MGGIIGAILTGIFQSHQVNSDITNGLIYNGDLHPIFIQSIAVVIVVLYSILLTWIIGRILQRISPIATTVEEDEVGLDQIVHGEKAYFYGELNKLNKRH